jgi:P-type E1-E2 ATPase
MEKRIEGLSGVEACRIRAQVGPNATPDVAINPMRLVLGKFLAPVSVLLEIAIVLQLALGEYVEGSIIGVLLVFNTAIGFFHESRAQSTIAALKSRLALNASVLRDGAWTIVPAVELVPADIVKLTLGTVVAADVLIRDGSILLDQSMLTGESLPVEAGPGTETYAGALVRRGEAVAAVLATGSRTKFGRTAELVRTAYVVSTQQKAVFRVVRNLAGFNGAVTLLLMIYAYEIGMPLSEVIPLVLISVLASVPVALPATFTLATAFGARALTRAGVLPTRLSAVDEAASLDVLCIDKTGTLTRNELAVAAIHPMPGFDENRVLTLAALASAEGGQDPVDAAVRAAAALHKTDSDLLKVSHFVPFDPTTKMSEARVIDHDGNALRIIKGAFAVVHGLSLSSPEAELVANELEQLGHRVLGVAISTDRAMRVVGIVALSDPPRSDSRPMIDQLRSLGVHTVMVTGDAATTAAFVADAVGLAGAVCLPGEIPERVGPDDFSVFAGVLPEDKFRLVKAFQNAGHTVGMCGDGANDAPGVASGADRHCHIHRHRRRQVGRGHCSDRGRACRDRRDDSGGPSHIPAHPDLCAAIHRSQVAAGALSWFRPDIDQACDPDTDAYGHFDDHRRFFGNVLDHRQRPTLVEAKLLADRYPHHRRHCPRTAGSLFLRRAAEFWFIGTAPRHRQIAHNDTRDTRLQWAGYLLCSPGAQASVVFAAESAGGRIKRSRHFNHWHVSAWRRPDGTARAFDCRRYSRCRHRAGACDGSGKRFSLCAL